MTNYEANRERTIRSIENQLRGINITTEQADRLMQCISLSALADLNTKDTAHGL